MKSLGWNRLQIHLKINSVLNDHQILWYSLLFVYSKMILCFIYIHLLAVLCSSTFSTDLIARRNSTILSLWKPLYTFEPETRFSTCITHKQSWRLGVWARCCYTLLSFVSLKVLSLNDPQWFLFIYHTWCNVSGNISLERGHDEYVGKIACHIEHLSNKGQLFAGKNIHWDFIVWQGFQKIAIHFQ